MKFNVILTALVAVAFNNVKAELAMCKQDYNQGSSLQCGPNHPPCVALKDEGKFIDHPNKPLNCDKEKKVCQYPEYSKMSVQCNQGKVDVTLAGASSSFVNHANNAFAYFVSNQCTQPSDTNSKQNGDTLVVDCNPIKGNGGKCEPDYAFNRNMTAKANFDCGPGKADCVTIVGGEGEIIQSPNKADNCDPFTRFCSFPKYSQLTVKCNQGTVTAQFAGKKNTFQNHAQNSLAYWMSNKCKGPSKNVSDQDGDLLVVDCNPLAPQHTNSWSFNH